MLQNTTVRRDGQCRITSSQAFSPLLSRRNALERGGVNERYWREGGRDFAYMGLAVRRGRGGDFRPRGVRFRYMFRTVLFLLIRQNYIYCPCSCCLCSSCFIGFALGTINWRTYLVGSKRPEIAF